MIQIYFLGATSNKRANTCCRDARLLLYEAMKTTPRSVGDWGVVCGGRGKQAQTKAKNDGNSDAGWGESDHNIMKGYKLNSPAFDIAPYCPIKKDYIWNDDNRWKLLHDHFYSVAKRMGLKIKCGVTLKSGKKDNPHIVLLYK